MSLRSSSFAAFLLAFAFALVPVSGATTTAASPPADVWRQPADAGWTLAAIGREAGERLVDSQGAAEPVRESAQLAGFPVEEATFAASNPVDLLLEAVDQAAVLQASALSTLTPADWDLIHQGSIAGLEVPPSDTTAVLLGLDAAATADQANLWQAAYILASAADQALLGIQAGIPLFGDSDQQSQLLLGPCVTVTIPTPLGTVAIDASTPGCNCNTTYNTWHLLIVELCGDDTYIAPAGGASFLNFLNGGGSTPISVVLDTVGNDLVDPDHDTAPLPAQAGAIDGGIAVTLDVFGDDRRGPPLGTGIDTVPMPMTNPVVPFVMGKSGHTIGGAGVNLGVGILVDAYGDDDNLARGLGFPGKWGAGYYYGAGVMVDYHGKDRYGGDEFEEGSGWYAGFGVLVDAADGSDQYFDHSTYSQGSGGYGGIGLLVDGIGDDQYGTFATYEQGAGLCGIGILADLTGEDSYQAASMGQGYGETLSDPLCLRLGPAAPPIPDPASLLAQVNAAVNALLAGQLPPVPPPKLPQPPGHLGVGILVDPAGGDTHHGGSLVQGAHLGPAIGVLADAQGDDTYTATAGCAQGFGDSAGVTPCSRALPILPPFLTLACNTVNGVLAALLGQQLPDCPTGFGVGALLEGEGDDTYTSLVNIGQGVAYGGSIGLFVDLQGVDAYAAPPLPGPVVEKGGLQVRSGLFGIAFDDPLI